LSSDKLNKVKIDKYRFVVQKHNSSRKHFDLRLEFKGMLKSWAVPQGIALNINEKRLAIETKDHPMEFLDYEDNSNGHNGENKKMEIWDKGTYAPIKIKPSESNEEVLESGFKRGKVSLSLEGEKLNGEYALVKTSFKSNDHWLIIKKQKKTKRSSKINI
jgi:bifunctional non-homologous end joining protein LigD